MTMFSHERLAVRDWQGRVHLLPIALGLAIAAGAIALVAYLLWPTWGANGSNGPGRLPVSVGNTLFNVPVAAIRMKIQRHSGPQERIDLNFSYPSLEPPDAPRHISADTVEEEMTQPIDRIFLSIAAHQNSMAPELRVQNIYPRYLEQAAIAGPGRACDARISRRHALCRRGPVFRQSATASTRAARATAAIPGMCLSERRIDGADLTFRFPRSWLAQWRDVAGAWTG